MHLVGINIEFQLFLKSFLTILSHDISFIWMWLQFSHMYSFYKLQLNYNICYKLGKENEIKIKVIEFKH